MTVQWSLKLRLKLFVKHFDILTNLSSCNDVFSIRDAGTCDNRYMSRRTGKPTICIGENKDADQLRGNREADQRLCFRYSDSTIPLLRKFEISSF